MISAEPIPVQDYRPSMESLQWQQEPSGTAESQNFYLISNEGAYVLICLAYSTLNSWSPAVQLAVRIYLPDGTRKTINANYSGSTLVVSADKMSCKAEGLSVKMIGTKNPDYEVKFQHPEVMLSFTLKADGQGFGFEKTPFKAAKPANGSILCQYAPRGLVQGVLMMNQSSVDMAGHGFFIHQVQNQPQSMARSHMIQFHSEDASVFLHSIEMPREKYDFEGKSWGSFFLKGRLEGAISESLTVYHDAQLDSFSGYDIPKAITHTLKGKTLEGEDLEITIQVNTESILDKVDVLAELPYIVRAFIQTFITSPFVYQWLQKTVVTVKRGDQVLQLEGMVMDEEAFLNKI